MSSFILNFIVVFLTTQSLGGVIGSALVGTFITWRTRFHLQSLAEQLTLSDPLVAQRIAQLAGAYGRVITDRGVALLGQQVTREATVLAYNDAFMIIAVCAACALAAMIIHLAIRAIRNTISPEPQPAVSS